MTDDTPTNKVSFFKKELDQRLPREFVYEIKLESMTDSVDDLIKKAKEIISFGKQ